MNGKSPYNLAKMGNGIQSNSIQSYSQLGENRMGAFSKINDSIKLKSSALKEYDMESNGEMPIGSKKLSVGHS